MYDIDNVFQKILIGKIPCTKVYEDEYVLAFNDINPKAKIHVIIIPKGSYINYSDFIKNSTAEEKLSYFSAIDKIAEKLDIVNSGYRIISNCGENGGQEVPHLHFHLLGSEKLKGF